MQAIAELKNPGYVKYDGTSIISFWSTSGEIYTVMDTQSNCKIDRYYKANVLSTERWYKNKKLHRIDGPAFQQWNSQSVLIEEKWYVDNQLHRLDGPALIWTPWIKFSIRNWFYKGQHHRDGLLPSTLHGQYMKRGKEYTLDLLKKHGRIILRFMKWCRFKRRRRQWRIYRALNHWFYNDVASVIIGFV